MIEQFKIETPSFLGKKFGSKKTLVGDGDKAVANHFHNVDKLLQIVLKMNQELADKIKIIEENFEKLDEQSNQINALEIELKKMEQTEIAKVDVIKELADKNADKNAGKNVDKNADKNADKNEQDLTGGQKHLEKHLENEESFSDETVGKIESKNQVWNSIAAEPSENKVNPETKPANESKDLEPYNEDEISKIQTLEKEMSELKKSLQDSQCQDRIFSYYFV